MLLVSQRVQHVVGHVGDRAQLVAGLGQDPRHVQGDVASPDHDRAARVQHELGQPVRVPAVPGDEVLGAETARQVLAGHAKPAIRTGAERVDHRVVVLAQLVGTQIGADLDTAEKPYFRLVQDAAQRGFQRLHLQVIGGDAVAEQTVRSREPIEDVHRDLAVFGQFFGRVQPGRAGPDDRDPQRIGHPAPASLPVVFPASEPSSRSRRRRPRSRYGLGTAQEVVVGGVLAVVVGGGGVARRVVVDGRGGVGL